MKNRLIKADNKSYQKTALFGNQSLQVVHKNRKAYSRKPKYKFVYSE